VCFSIMMRAFHHRGFTRLLEEGISVLLLSVMCGGVTLSIYEHQAILNSATLSSQLFFFWILLFFIAHVAIDLSKLLPPARKRAATAFIAWTLFILFSALELTPLPKFRATEEKYSGQVGADVVASAFNNPKFVPPATWLIDEKSFTPPPQCSAVLSVIILSIQFRCGVGTIHGLWYSPEGPCTNCRVGNGGGGNLSKFTPRLLKDAGLLKDLERNWPTCLARSTGSTNEKFWKHEWEKHGVCTGLSQQDYFSIALRLFNEHAHRCQPSHQGKKKMNRKSVPRDCRLCFKPSMDLQQPPYLC